MQICSCLCARMFISEGEIRRCLDVGQSLHTRYVCGDKINRVDVLKLTKRFGFMMDHMNEVINKPP